MKKIPLTISIIVTLVFIFVACINSTARKTDDTRGSAYAGAASCMQCHKEIYNNYQHSEHLRTSWPVKELPADISVRADSFRYTDHVKVAIEKRDSGLYQVGYVDGKETIARRFDIAFGSGEKAYTFGYWNEKKLNELPLSFFTSIQQWANSPGFPPDRAYFDRPIIRRCFECHSSYIAADVVQTENLSNIRNLDRNSIIYGVDCERCHGPAGEHVSFHTDNPTSTESHYMVSWKSLTRQQKLDVCGVCHSGNDQSTQMTTFAFRPGDTLSKFYFPEFGSSGPPSPDVHGKQVQLLSASRCFIGSKTLECATCHNSHEAGAKDMKTFTQQCMNCHQGVQHDATLTSLGDVVTSKCIDCHMPNEISNIISFRLMGKEKANDYLLRTHRIAVYPEETKKIIAAIKKN